MEPFHHHELYEHDGLSKTNSSLFQNPSLYATIGILPRQQMHGPSGHSFLHPSVALIVRARGRLTFRRNANSARSRKSRDCTGSAPRMIIVLEAYNKTIFHRRTGARADTSLLCKNFVYLSLASAPALSLHSSKD